MNKLISIIRIVTLAVIGMLAMIFLFGAPGNANLADWLTYFIIDKAIACGAIVLFIQLYKHWSKVDPWLIAYNKMCDEVLDKPNPTKF